MRNALTIGIVALVFAVPTPLAAIQALERRSREQEAEIGRLNAKLEALTRRLEAVLGDALIRSRAR